jgi:putative ABC transport system permease protein
MNKLKINVGDTIKIRNKLTLKEYDLLIQDCADINMGQCIFMPIGKYIDMTGSKQKYYSGMFSMEKQDIEEKNIVSLSKRDELLEGVETMIKPIRGLLYLLSILSFIIGLLILYVVISMLIEENRSNISLFKVLGYHKKEISSLIINSTTILVLIGFVLSIPLIIQLSQMLLNAITETMSFYFYATLKPLSTLYGFVLIMLTFIISKAISKRKLNSVSMVDSLKARE